jgi:DNA-binding NarL/FixJ family response regulator
MGQMTYPELPSLIRFKYPSLAQLGQIIIQGSTHDVHRPIRDALGSQRIELGSYRTSKRQRGVRLLNNEGEEIIRVAIVDDQRLFTRGLRGLVEMLPGVEVVGVAYDGEEGVALCREEEPDVVLMDISMPRMDGISATREIKDLLPQTAVVILTGHEEDEHVFEGIKAGAQGYLLKDSEPEDLSRAIRTVHAGNTIIAPDLAQKMLNTFEGGRSGGDSRVAPPPLTERELEVIRALARGMSDRQIAHTLGISEKTVRNHTSNIYRKLHIFDRTQAVIYAVREGVIDVGDLEYRPPSGP